MKASTNLGLALVTVAALAGVAGAQTSIRRLTPIPPHRGAIVNGLLQSSPSERSSSPWKPLKNQPTFLADGACNPLLLTDGTVMVQDCGFQDWWRLTPDDKGSYINGTWTQLASLPSDYSPLYHSSAVLRDGRVIIEGGEYNFLKPKWTNLGAIYDPLANTWTPVDPPSGWTTIGDAQSVVLPNGTYMQANCCSKQAALLDEKTLTWTPTGSGKFDINDEEGWNLLPTRDVLTVDAYFGSYDPTGKNSELYNPKSGEWHSAGSTIVQLWDSAADCGGHASFELGPAVLRPNGTVFYTGANSCGAGHTAIYNSYKGTWTAGPDFPDALDIADGPASILPDGHVLVMTSPGIFQTGAVFFEFDGHDLDQVPGPPNAPGDSSYYGNMLVLPTGQVLFTDFSDDIEIYTAAGKYHPDWAPRIDEWPTFVKSGETYRISGRQFNGVSTGASYGDDAQANTNYPLVRVKNLFTGHVAYWRTHDHSTMAVATRHEYVWTHFDVPENVEPGIGLLEVVANGIPSQPRIVFISSRNH